MGVHNKKVGKLGFIMLDLKIVEYGPKVTPI